MCLPDILWPYFPAVGHGLLVSDLFNEQVPWQKAMKPHVVCVNLLIFREKNAFGVDLADLGKGAKEYLGR